MMPKKFESKWANKNGTCLTNSQSGQNQKRNFGGIFLNMARKDFDISEKYITQTIYVNYLGIFRVTEIWVASQPRTDRVIPLTEKDVRLRGGVEPRPKVVLARNVSEAV
jgi:hypothetical protein